MPHSRNRSAFRGFETSRSSSAIRAKGNQRPQVGIVGCSDSWRFYSDGVLDYGDRKLNHCVQLVGYDTSANPPYW